MPPTPTLYPSLRKMRCLGPQGSRAERDRSSSFMIVPVKKPEYQ